MPDRKDDAVFVIVIFHFLTEKFCVCICEFIHVIAVEAAELYEDKKGFVDWNGVPNPIW